MAEISDYVGLLDEDALNHHRMKIFSAADAGALAKDEMAQRMTASASASVSTSDDSLSLFASPPATAAAVEDEQDRGRKPLEDNQDLVHAILLNAAKEWLQPDDHGDRKPGIIAMTKELFEGISRTRFGDEVITTAIKGYADKLAEKVSAFNAEPDSRLFGGVGVAVEFDEAKGGLVVTEAYKGSKGLAVGDIITHVDGKKVTSLEQGMGLVRGELWSEVELTKAGADAVQCTRQLFDTKKKTSVDFKGMEDALKKIPVLEKRVGALEDELAKRNAQVAALGDRLEQAMKAIGTLTERADRTEGMAGRALETSTQSAEAVETGLGGIDARVGHAVGTQMQGVRGALQTALDAKANVTEVRDLGDGVAAVGRKADEAFHASHAATDAVAGIGNAVGQAVAGEMRGVHEALAGKADVGALEPLQRGQTALGQRVTAVEGKADRALDASGAATAAVEGIDAAVRQAVGQHGQDVSQRLGTVEEGLRGAATADALRESHGALEAGLGQLGQRVGVVERGLDSKATAEALTGVSDRVTGVEAGLRGTAKATDLTAMGERLGGRLDAQGAEIELRVKTERLEAVSQEFHRLLGAKADKTELEALGERVTNIEQANRGFTAALEELRTGDRGLVAQAERIAAIERAAIGVEGRLEQQVDAKVAEGIHAAKQEIVGQVGIQAEALIGRVDEAIRTGITVPIAGMRQEFDILNRAFGVLQGSTDEQVRGITARTAEIAERLGRQEEATTAVTATVGSHEEDINDAYRRLGRIGEWAKQVVSRSDVKKAGMIFKSDRLESGTRNYLGTDVSTPRPSARGVGGEGVLAPRTLSYGVSAGAVSPDGPPPGTTPGSRTPSGRH